MESRSSTTTTTTTTTTMTTSRQLFQLASEEQWNQLQVHLETLTDGDPILLEPYGSLAPEPVPPDCSLLHVVCSSPSAPPSIVERLLRQAPPLATVRDELGRNPLHVAIGEGSGQPSIVRILAQAAPQAAQQRDESFCTPIEVLAQLILMQEERAKYNNNHAHHSHPQTAINLNNNNKPKQKVDRLWDCVQPLAVASSTTSSTTRQQDGRDWDSPVLHACLRAVDFPYALLERARKRYSDQFQKPDNRGNYPLHILAGWDPEEDDFLGTVANQYPPAAKATNARGELPFDIARGTRGWDTGIAQLLQVYPAPERFRIAEASHLLARAAGQQRSTLIFEVLRNQPALFTYHKS